ncbi:hypothetical protein NL676_025331 [Syzygium grande]|nr:hypothetical protein NL676_025331 [Syzygium grande]
MQRLKIIGPRSTAHARGIFAQRIESTAVRVPDLNAKSFQARSRRSRPPPPFISSAASLQASEPASIQSNTGTNHRPPLYLLLPSSFPPSNRTPRSSDRSASLSRFTPMEMSAVSSSLAPVRSPRPRLSSGCPLKPSVQCLGSVRRNNLLFSTNQTGMLQLRSSRQLTVSAEYRDGGRPSSASIFVGGFVLGGIIVGALGCVYAPQISKALAGTDRKDLMRKLPKFIYDEEKALEKTRKVLAEKIAQLNSAIDDVSSQLRTEDSSDEIAVAPDEIEAAV